MMASKKKYTTKKTHGYRHPIKNAKKKPRHSKKEISDFIYLLTTQKGR